MYADRSYGNQCYPLQSPKELKQTIHRDQTLSLGSIRRHAIEAVQLSVMRNTLEASLYLPRWRRPRSNYEKYPITLTLSDYLIKARANIVCRRITIPGALVTGLRRVT